MAQQLSHLAMALRFAWRRLAVILSGLAAYIGVFFLPLPRFVVHDILPASWVVPLLIMTFAYFDASKADQLARQHYRERLALSHLGQMRDGTYSFFLYLRPFASTGGVRVLRRAARRKRGPVGLLADNLGPGPLYAMMVVWNDLEALLEKYLRRYAPLIGLGRPGEQIGAARIASEEASWRDLVIDLANNAWLIFALPSSDPGMEWEFNFITSNPEILQKTVFIVPGSENAKDWIADRVSGAGIEGRNSYLGTTERPDLGARPYPSRDVRRVPEPLRLSNELKQGAIISLELLVGDSLAVSRARNAPAGALIMFDEHRRLRLFYSLRGYTTFSLNPADKGPVYRLDIGALKNALADVRDSAAGSVPTADESDNLPLPIGEPEPVTKFGPGLAWQTGWFRNGARIAAAVVVLLIVVGFMVSAIMDVLRAP